jgi:hypothetical protein
MLWYGKASTPSPHKILKRNSYNYIKTFQRKLVFKKKLHFSAISDLYLYFPRDWQITLLKPKRVSAGLNLIYSYSNLYYFKIPIPLYETKLYYTPSLGILSTRAFVAPPLLRLYFKSISDLFLLFSRIWFRKVKIRGKGYYIYKTLRNTVTHQFGHSHRIYLYLFNVGIKFLSKTQIFLYGVSKKDVFKSSSQIRSSKPLNIFTSRGVRFSRQVIYKKTGKVSSYR